MAHGDLPSVSVDLTTSTVHQTVCVLRPGVDMKSDTLDGAVSQFDLVIFWPRSCPRHALSSLRQSKEAE